MMITGRRDLALSSVCYQELYFIKYDGAPQILASPVAVGADYKMLSVCAVMSEAAATAAGSALSILWKPAVAAAAFQLSL